MPPANLPYGGLRRAECPVADASCACSCHRPGGCPLLLVLLPTIASHILLYRIYIPHVHGPVPLQCPAIGFNGSRQIPLPDEMKVEPPVLRREGAGTEFTHGLICDRSFLKTTTFAGCTGPRALIRTLVLTFGNYSTYNTTSVVNLSITFYIGQPAFNRIPTTPPYVWL